MSEAREPNSQECAYYGRKLSNVRVPEIEISVGDVCIGSDCDDEIYFDPPESPTLKERVKIYAELNEDLGFFAEIDLEDVLRFAARHCRGIYDRVASEEIQIEEVKRG